jgi:hypothetical protein
MRHLTRDIEGRDKGFFRHAEEASELKYTEPMYLCTVL